MSDQSARTFSSDFKRFFLRGLVILLPSVLTLWIVVKAYQFVDTAIADPINRGVRVALNQAAPYWSPLGETFNPTEAQVNAAVAARAEQRRLIDRERARRELRDQMRSQSDDPNVSPTDNELNAYLAGLAEVSAINVAAVRTELRQQEIDEWWNARWYMNFIGLAIAVVAVYVAGRVLGGFFGRQIYRKLEGVITTVPVFKQVYPYVKQIVDFLFSDDQPIKFNRVVVVEYPRKGIWSIGFLTGSTLKAVAARAGDSLTVFVPSSPTPFTGYTISVPRDDVIEVPISVEEAIRFTVSGGVLIPDHQNAEVLPHVQGDGEPAVATAAGSNLHIKLPDSSAGAKRSGGNDAAGAT